MNLKLRNKWSIIILLFIVSATYIGYKITYKPHSTIQEKTTDYTGSSSELLTQINTNPQQWTNKIVDISGKITQSDSLSFMLGSNIYCQKNTRFSTQEFSNTNSMVRIKGRIIGYDDLLEELKLDQVILINQ